MQQHLKESENNFHKSEMENKNKLEELERE